MKQQRVGFSGTETLGRPLGTEWEATLTAVRNSISCECLHSFKRPLLLCSGVPPFTGAPSTSAPQLPTHSTSFHHRRRALGDGQEWKPQDISLIFWGND